MDKFKGKIYGLVRSKICMSKDMGYSMSINLPTCMTNTNRYEHKEKVNVVNEHEEKNMKSQHVIFC